jgi:hypothetical protein
MAEETIRGLEGELKGVKDERTFLISREAQREEDHRVELEAQK